uniref:Uncharacterized protein n=1 Tax=Salix viminalis TaxID=40686 RepID=A0A6N2L9G7_SALVM
MLLHFAWGIKVFWLRATEFPEETMLRYNLAQGIPTEGEEQPINDVGRSHPQERNPRARGELCSAILQLAMEFNEETFVTLSIL